MTRGTYSKVRRTIVVQHMPFVCSLGNDSWGLEIGCNLSLPDNFFYRNSWFKYDRWNPVITCIRWYSLFTALWSRLFGRSTTFFDSVAALLRELSLVGSKMIRGANSYVASHMQSRAQDKTNHNHTTTHTECRALLPNIIFHSLLTPLGCELVRLGLSLPFIWGHPMIDIRFVAISADTRLTIVAVVLCIQAFLSSLICYLGSVKFKIGEQRWATIILLREIIDDTTSINNTTKNHTRKNNIREDNTTKNSTAKNKIPTRHTMEAMSKASRHQRHSEAD